MTATLYGDLKAAGVPIDNHESDLYFQDTQASRTILKRFPESLRLSKNFEVLSDHSVWFEVPFAFLPWWEQHEQRRLCRALGQPELIEPDDLKD